MEPTSHDDLAVALNAARVGAEAVRTWLGRIDRADYKGEVDPVTAADRASEAEIVDALRRARPDDAILAEEGGGTDSEADRLWIIDPLDGTVNFLHSVPHVGVSVALYDKGRPRVGVIIDVFRKEEFSAVVDGGARRNGDPIGVSRQSDLGAALVATGFPYDRREHARIYSDAVGEVLGRVQGIRRMGTASLDLAWVACGRYDAFWELKLAPWDVAAGILLVREAGGIATDLDGRPAQPGDRVVVASNANLYRGFRALIDEALPAEVR